MWRDREWSFPGSPGILGIERVSYRRKPVSSARSAKEKLDPGSSRGDEHVAVTSINTHASIPATAMPSGLCQGLFPEGKRRAEKRKPMVSAILADRGGRLTARHCARVAPAIAQQELAAFSFRRRAAFSNFGSCAGRRKAIALFLTRYRPSAYLSANAQNVSQLLAGLLVVPSGAPAPPECLSA